MEQLDETIRTELHSPFKETTTDHIWDEVSQRVARRRHRRSTRKRASVALSLVLVAGALVIGLSGGDAKSTHQPLVVDPPAGPGGFSVVPKAGLVNNEAVTVSIHGLRPNAAVLITMCVGRPKSAEAGDSQCDAPAKTADLDSHGAASVTFTVHRFLSPGGYEVDCATYAAGCSVALVEADTLASSELIANTEALTFRGGPPAPPPNPLQISAAPNAPYADGQAVKVSGTGFPASTPVRVAECPTNIDCGTYFQTVQSTPQGTFGSVVTLHRTYTVEQGDADGGESPVQIDCSQPLRCFIVAEEAMPPYRSASSIPLTFAATQ